MSTSNIFAAIDSSVFELEDTTSIDSTSIYWAPLSNKYKKSRCQQLENIATFMGSYYKNFS